MSIDSAETQTDAFIRFLTQHRDGRLKTLSPEECVDEYRAYQAQFQRFVDESQESVAQARRGEAETLEMDALLERVDQRFADNGIVE